MIDLLQIWYFVALKKDHLGWFCSEVRNWVNSRRGQGVTWRHLKWTASPDYLPSNPLEQSVLSRSSLGCGALNRLSHACATKFIAPAGSTFNRECVHYIHIYIYISIYIIHIIYIYTQYIHTYNIYIYCIYIYHPHIVGVFWDLPC